MYRSFRFPLPVYSYSIVRRSHTLALCGGSGEYVTLIFLINFLKSVYYAASYDRVLDLAIELRRYTQCGRERWNRVQT